MVRSGKSGRKSKAEVSNRADTALLPNYDELLSQDDQYVMKLCLEGNLEDLTNLFTLSGIDKDRCYEQLMTRSKSNMLLPLEAAVSAGNDKIVKFILDVVPKDVIFNEDSFIRGYLLQHRASCWGRPKVLKVLYEYGMDLERTTFYGETCKDIASRYAQEDCIDYLIWAEARDTCFNTIISIRTIITDPEKVQGKLSREEKSRCIATCKELEEWILKTEDPTLDDIKLRVDELKTTLSPLFDKMSYSIENFQPVEMAPPIAT